MKNLLILLLLILSGTVSAQNWLNNFDQAKKMSQAEHKPILLVFEGSDWCAPCKKLERDILSPTEFKEFAKEHLILLKADFPRRKKNRLPKLQQKHNDALAAKYNPEGIFPTILILDSEGNILGQTGYLPQKSPQYYINWIKEKSNN